MKKEYTEKIVRALENSHHRSLSADKLAAVMRIRRAERPAFLISLQRLEQSGRLKKDRSGKYGLNTGKTLLPRSRGEERGRVCVLHPGFGFVTLQNGHEDCFVPGRGLGDALPGDIVSVALGAPDSRGKQGRITQILEPGRRIFTGRLYRENRRWFVRADGGFRYALPVREKSVGDCHEEDMIRFSVKRGREGDWLASVEQVYGCSDSAKICADALIDSRGLPTVFSDAALEEARLKQEMGVTAADREGREDFRALPVFTIDGRDAKDLDDAVSLEKLTDGWRLGVHIADVSHYVTPGSSLDKDALERGTSVYFADRVIPMLPVELSNGICSLNAGEDKLTLSAVMTLDENGKILDGRVVKSFIRSAVRGVYSEVNAIFDGTADGEMLKKYSPVSDELASMRILAQKMKQNAHDRGTMDLISVEARFVLDENGVPTDIVARQTGEAEQMIEQFMITANVAVARLARTKKLPFVYRIHEYPNEERLGKLFDAARLMELPVPSSAHDVPQSALQQLMNAAKDTPYARLISEQLLRCMAKARYEENPKGHYGLSLADYCHFTSPIRRYPDLMIHRILSKWLSGKTPEKLQTQLEDTVREVSVQTSECEVRAMGAERDCEDCYKAEYMRRFLGQSFDGVIVSVTEMGLYVELPNTVCGLLPRECLPEEELSFDEVASLIDRLGKKRYTIGQPMRVRVAASDVAAGRITYDLPTEEKV